MTNILNKPKYFFALLNAKKRITIEQGGTSSGKTYTTLDVLFYIGIQEPNSVITVVGQDVPNLKKGAYRDAKNIFANSPDYQSMYEKPNETDRIFKCKNGSIIEFTSYQDEQDFSYRDWETDRKSTRLNSSHSAKSRMPSSA